MTANTYQILSIIAFSLAGGLLVATVLMFFKLDILEIIGDLSGKTAEKEIQVIREQNQEKGEHRYKPSTANMPRGQLNERQGISGRLRKRETPPEPDNAYKYFAGKGNTEPSGRRGPIIVNTGDVDPSRIEDVQNRQTDLLHSTNSKDDTGILTKYPVTATLYTNDAQDMADMHSPYPQTEILSQTEALSQTEVLSQTEELREPGTDMPPGETEAFFVVIKDIVLIHTEESI